jgi:hypothetical protein
MEERFFEYALREETSSLFNRMLTECLENEEYSKAVEARDESYSTESLFYGFNISAAAKMISQLIERLAKN